jgi:hypothetical protein
VAYLPHPSLSWKDLYRTSGSHRFSTDIKFAQLKRGIGDWPSSLGTTTLYDTVTALNAKIKELKQAINNLTAGREEGVKGAVDEAMTLWHAEIMASNLKATMAPMRGLFFAVTCLPDADLDGRTGQWVRRMVMNSPTAIACCKAALNAGQDGAAGIAQMGGELTRLFYQSAEGQEGRQAFLEKRAPKFRSKL